MKDLRFFWTILDHLRKNRYRYFAALLVMGVLTALILRAFTPFVPEVDSDKIGWKGVVPNQEVSEDTLKNLGVIVAQEEIDGKTRFSYESEFKTKPNQVVIDEDNRVVFIKENVLSSSGDTLQTYIDEFGEPDMVLYEPQIGYSVRAHVFLSAGLVVIAHVDQGQVEQKWFFAPTTAEIFLQSWGAGLESEIKDEPEPFNL